MSLRPWSCLLLCVALLSACESGPLPSRFAKQHAKGPCAYDDFGPVGEHSVKIDHQPVDKGFASGDFDASVTVWVTTREGTKLQRFDIPNDKLVATITSDNGMPVTAVAIQRCDAYEPLILTARG
jgi:hypothetical protein